jgi:glycosyltransferase involved in cell wall biosynthesis
MNPKVSVLILNWNRKDETCYCIDSILNQSYKNIEIVIIDNGSTDDSLNYIKSKYNEKIKYIYLDKNYGCPGGRNIGLKYCSGEYIFFCDNDGMLHYEAIENSLKHFNTSDDIAIVTGIVKEYNILNNNDLNFNLSNNLSENVCNFLGGVCLLKINPFIINNNYKIYPDNYIYGGEEEYLSYRLIDNGFKIIKAHNVILFHKSSIFARNYNMELFNKWNNRFLNAYQLFPLEHLFIYFFYFIIFSSIRAIRLMLFIEFIKSLITMFDKLYNLNRQPVKRLTFYKIKLFKYL